MAARAPYLVSWNGTRGYFDGADKVGDDAVLYAATPARKDENPEFATVPG